MKKRGKRVHDARPDYWEHYSNLQRVKHELIRRYLGGWYAKQGYTTGRAIYFDTHAGKGEHKTGDPGSPIIALRTLLEHSHLPNLLSGCEFRFDFVELDTGNVSVLKAVIRALGPLPEGVKWHVHRDDYQEALSGLVRAMKNRKLAPSFFFVDPYTFLLPGRILARLMSFRGVELFVNVIWRELDMAIQNELARRKRSRQADNLDSIFHGDRWLDLDKDAIPDIDDRALHAAELFREMTGARWATAMSMLGKNGRTRYVLVHLTNHPAGRDLMKDCMWRICPDGEFVAHQSTDWNQQVLVSADPDLRSLKRWLTRRLAKRPRRWEKLKDQLRATLWQPKHLWSVIREMKKAGELEATDYGDRFAQNRNPSLHLSQDDDA